MKYRKKPIEIEAVQWTGNNIEEILKFIADDKGSFDHLPDDGVFIKKGIGHSPVEGSLDIPTLEGVMKANAGDWIIKGVKGEFYPCKPDIFEITYEKVENVV